MVPSWKIRLREMQKKCLAVISIRDFFQFEYKNKKPGTKYKQEIIETLITYSTW